MKVKIALALTLAVTAFILLSAEGGLFSDHLPAETRAWISELPKSADGRVDPLPQLKPQVPAVFVGGKRDPFSPYR